MKYSEKNKPLVCMMTQSTCYKGTTTMTPKGVLWHSTGANNPTLKRYVQPDDDAPDREELIALIGKNKYNNDWNHISRQAGLNAWIGKLEDGSVTSIQTMPWNYKPWGCGSGSKGSCNNGWMQFEICEDDLTDKDYFEKVYKEACELTAYYCKMYNLNPKGTVEYNGVTVPVILDHATSYDLKLGGNHGDVQHWFSRYGKTLDDVRNDVAKLMGIKTEDGKIDGKYVKGTAVQLAKNFKSTEFDCHGKGCCSETLVDQKLVGYLQKIRDHFGKSVNVSSGYRCVIHNSKPSVGGSTGSKHTKGQAADIFINGVAPIEIARYAESLGILGIGLYETDKDGHFVHVDTRTTKAFWYGQAQEPRTTFKEAPPKPVTPTPELYRVRKSWSDTKSQIGPYTVLENAKRACDKAGADYHVYNIKGEEVYSPKDKQEEIKVDPSKVDTSAADPKKVWDYLKKQGLNDFGVAGLMGNLLAESGLRPCNLQNTYEKKLGMTDAEYTASVDAGVYDNFVKDSAGYGLAQWTYWSRKQAMLKFHQAAKKSIGDLDTQLAFLVKELSESYKSVWNTLKTATTVVEASNAVLLQYERPADQSLTVQTVRAKYGQSYYDKYKASAPAPTPTPSVKEEVKSEKFKENDVVKIKSDAVYYNGKTVPVWVKEKTWIISSVSGDRVIINKSTDGKNAINSPIHEKYLELASDSNPKKEEPKEEFVPYLVKVDVSILNYRNGPGIDYKINGTVRRGQIYTIVDEKDGWGKLKSGAGWLRLSYTKKV